MYRQVLAVKVKTISTFRQADDDSQIFSQSNFSLSLTKVEMSGGGQVQVTEQAQNLSSNFISLRTTLGIPMHSPEANDRLLIPTKNTLLIEMWSQGSGEPDKELFLPFQFTLVCGTQVIQATKTGI